MRLQRALQRLRIFGRRIGHIVNREIRFLVKIPLGTVHIDNILHISLESHYIAGMAGRLIVKQRLFAAEVMIPVNAISQSQLNRIKIIVFDIELVIGCSAEIKRFQLAFKSSAVKGRVILVFKGFALPFLETFIRHGRAHKVLGSLRIAAFVVIHAVAVEADFPDAVFVAYFDQLFIDVQHVFHLALDLKAQIPGHTGPQDTYIMPCDRQQPLLFLENVKKTGKNESVLC